MIATPTFIQRDVPLAPRTTLGVGGAAAWFAPCADRAQVREALRTADGRGLPLALLGGGSNTLVCDGGFAGLVLAPQLLGVEVERVGDAVHLHVQAGEPWDGLVARAVAEGWAGIECLAGIPGTVGSAPIQNIGAYGQALADVCVAVTAWDRARGAEVTLPAAECGFGYRESRFKAAPGALVVLSVTLALRPGGAPTVRYPQLAAHLPAGADLASTRDTVLALRRSKSMVYDPADPNHRSAGSFFMNPVVPTAQADAAWARLAAAGVAGPMPRWPAGPGLTKLSAAWLIERAGFQRGVGEGRVGLSSRHTLALINRGGARAEALLRFAARVRAGVWRATGVRLHPEPVVLGGDGPVADLLDRLAGL